MISKNNKSRDFEVLETFEAGLILNGHEVKAVRLGNFQLTGSWIDIDKLALVSSVIETDAPEWLKYNSQRERGILLNKKEIRKLRVSLTQGLSIIPLHSFLMNGKIKLKIALVKGLKKHDKREKLKKNQYDRSDYD